MLLLTLGSCGGTETTGPAPVARIGGLAVDAAMLEHVAERDALSEADARQRTLDIARLVAARRQERAIDGDASKPALPPRRAEHLRRAALARLWLEERFEPEHGPDDIPNDDPRLQRAREDTRLVHPELHQVCQVVVQPPGVDDLDTKAVITARPQWQEAAQAALDPVLERIERNVPVGDPEACQLIQREIQLSEAPTDPELELSFPKPGGFDLSACVQVRESDGECIQPLFDPAWTAKVGAMDAPSLSSPFFTRFGLHLVYLADRLPAQPAGDPATERALREIVLDAWRAEQLDVQLQQMGKARSVRLVQPSGDES